MTRHVLVRECPPSPKSMNIMGVDLNSCCITVFLLIKASSWRSSFLASNHSKEREVHSVHTRQSCPKLLYERCMWIPPPHTHPNLSNNMQWRSWMFGNRIHLSTTIWAALCSEWVTGAADLSASAGHQLFNCGIIRTFGGSDVASLAMLTPLPSSWCDWWSKWGSRRLKPRLTLRFRLVLCSKSFLYTQYLS